MNEAPEPEFSVSVSFKHAERLCSDHYHTLSSSFSAINIKLVAELSSMCCWKSYHLTCEIECPFFFRYGKAETNPIGDHYSLSM